MKRRTVLTFFVTLGMLFLLCGCGKTKVDLNNYISLECEGYDNLGTAAPRIDFERMVSENLSAFGLSESSTKTDEKAIVSDLSLYISGEINNDKELSNGDVVSFTWNVDNESLCKAYPIDPVYSVNELTVSGLEVLKDFDPFDGVQVSFGGVAPLGTVTYISNEKAVGDSQYDADIKENLSNNDVIKLRVFTPDTDDYKEYCRSFGLNPTCTEKEYTVTGLDSYVNSIGDIPKDKLEDFNIQSQDTFSTYNPNIQKFELTFLGNYLLFSKDVEESLASHKAVNTLYYIYKVKTEDTETKKEIKYFYYTLYDNLEIKSDGSFVVKGDSCVPPAAYEESFSVEKTECVGYKDLESLYKAQVASVSEQYSCESTVKDK